MLHTILSLRGRILYLREVMLGLQLLVQGTSVIYQSTLLDQLTCALYQQKLNFLVTENIKETYSYIKLGVVVHMVVRFTTTCAISTYHH